MCAKHGRLHRGSQGTSVILNELWRDTQEKMVAVQIKLQEWKWTGHVMEDSSATEKASCELEPPRTTKKRRPRKNCRKMVEKAVATEGKD